MLLVKIQMTVRSIPCELMKNRIITSWGVDEIRGRQIKTGEHMDDAMHILTQSWIRKIIVLWSISDENKPKKWYSLSDEHTWPQHTLAWFETAISIKWSIYKFSPGVNQFCTILVAILSSMNIYKFLSVFAKVLAFSLFSLNLEAVDLTMPLSDKVIEQ